MSLDTLEGLDTNDISSLLALRIEIDRCLEEHGYQPTLGSAEMGVVNKPVPLVPSHCNQQESPTVSFEAPSAEVNRPKISVKLSPTDLSEVDRIGEERRRVEVVNTSGHGYQKTSGVPFYRLFREIETQIMAGVDKHADWTIKTLGFIVKLSRENSGCQYLAEEIRWQVDQKIGKCPGDNRLWGGVMRYGQKLGILFPNGEGRTKSSHGKKKVLWVLVAPKEEIYEVMI